MKRCIATVSLLLVLVACAWAYPNGISGQTTSGCTCHSTSSSSATSLSLSGPTTVNPSSTTTFTLTLQNSSRPMAGLDLAIVNSSGQNAGSLGTVSGQLTQLMGGELTHTQPKSLSGGSVSWQFTWQAPSTPGQYTVRAVGNAVNGNGNADAGDQWNFLQNTTITVKGISITAPTPSQILCAGGSVTLQWTSYGISSVVVALSSDGGNSFTTVGTLTSQDGQNSSNFTLPSSLSPGNQYRIRLTDAADNTISSTTQNLTVASPPSITAHPQNAAVCEGATVNFSVTATGSNLSYQWRRNGTNLSGATQATLTLSGVTTAQAGSYDCVVSGSCGQPLTSNTATLTINPQTTITAHPQSATVCQGASITFSVTATGTNLRYQWKKGTQDIAGATAASYSIASVALADTGLYACTVSGDCGSPTSNQAQLQVAIPPAITTQPQSQTLCEGQALTLSVATSRAIANLYQWKKDGAPLNDGGRIQGTRTATLRITDLSSNDAGSYAVEITNAICQGSTTSNPAAVTVNAKPVITTEPQSQTVTRGSSVTFSVTASGSALQYQWFRNGQPISGATDATYSITNAQDSHAGSYYVTISNECGSVQSRQVTLTVTDQPTPVLELSQGTITFLGVRVGVSDQLRIQLYNRGTAPLQLNQASISGSGASAFSITVTLPATVAPGDSLSATLSFTPTTAGSFTATLSVTSNGGDRTATLSGQGFARALTPETVSFDTTQTGESTQQTVRLCNQTGAMVTVDSLTIAGDDAAAFELIPGPWMMEIRNGIGALACHDIPIRFRPTRSGIHQAVVRLSCRQLTAPFSEEIILQAVATQSSSVSEAERFGVRILPNPATDEVSFDVGDRTALVRIFDARGIQVHTATAQAVYHWHTQDSNGVPVAAGVYTVVLALPDRTLTVPIVIVR
ncbi:MAG: hypothetical protein KatS3mg039_1561 [Candidatus Kapaibacterium sp.]|nr:MAG: hypothetical protein KatS3mg039_1561 [Candidatus Kapabacteria bacterium]